MRTLISNKQELARRSQEQLPILVPRRLEIVRRIDVHERSPITCRITQDGSRVVGINITPAYRRVNEE